MDIKFDIETLIEIEDYIEQLNNDVGLKIETLLDVKRAICKAKNQIKK